MVFPPLKGRKIILASGSPRRRELIQTLGFEVEVAPLRYVDEIYPRDLPLEEVPLYISRNKARAFEPGLKPGEVLVTADTVVLLDGEVIGKPVDADDAKRMLRRLSGRTHVVVTGVTLTTDQGMETFSERTEVDFAPLTDEEIAFYVDTCRPLDKAGSYGIQEWIGHIGVKAVRGDYYNVMGLPLHHLYRRLTQVMQPA